MLSIRMGEAMEQLKGGQFSLAFLLVLTAAVGVGIGCCLAARKALQGVSASELTTVLAIGLVVVCVSVGLWGVSKVLE